MQKCRLLTGTGVLLCVGIAMAIYLQKPGGSAAQNAASSATSAKYAVFQLPQSHSAIAPRADMQPFPPSTLPSQPIARGTIAGTIAGRLAAPSPMAPATQAATTTAAAHIPQNLAAARHIGTPPPVAGAPGANATPPVNVAPKSVQADGAPTPLGEER